MTKPNDEGFFQQCLIRLKHPWSETSFIGYLLLVPIIFGGFGVIFSLFYEGVGITTIFTAFSTYYMALLATSSLELMLDFPMRRKLSAILYGFIFFIIGIALMILSKWMMRVFPDTYWLLVPLLAGILFSLVIWVIANAYNDNLFDAGFYQKMKEGTDQHGGNWDNV